MRRSRPREGGLLRAATAAVAGLAALSTVGAAATAEASSGSNASDGVCTQPPRNTLTNECYGACGGVDESYPLCVSYAPPSAQSTSVASGDGNYYYRGCAFSNMPTCQTAVTPGNCEMQCLLEDNDDPRNWTLNIGQPQSDKGDTAFFQFVDKLWLPSTLVNLTIAGTTEDSRIVPLFLAGDTFTSGYGLEEITITNVRIRNITTNIFPDSLRSLAIQGCYLKQFDPRGTHAFISATNMDLSNNSLSDIPPIIYEMRNLSTLYLQGNSISNAHVSLPQLKFLQSLPIFEANLTVSDSCSLGYEAVSWDDKSVCYMTSDGMSDINGSGSEQQVSSTASIKGFSSAAIFAILGIILFTILAVIGGILFLRRWKRKTGTQQQQRGSARTSENGRLKSSVRNLRVRLGATNSTMQMNELEESLNTSSSGSMVHKATFKQIAQEDIAVMNVLARSDAVSVAVGEYRTQLVLVTKLQIPSDDVEAAMNMVPTLSQLHHPQLLSITGLMWDDNNVMLAVCEYMAFGTLTGFLRSSGKKLNWKNFKMKAAAEIARGLMYLHTQIKVTYDGLNGKTIFVGAGNTCKLNPMLAALPFAGAPAPYLSRTSERSRRNLHRGDSSTKAFFAPEILVGEPSRSSSDMYAFGVLLAHLDTCDSADEMIRSSWRLRTTQLGDMAAAGNGSMLFNDLDSSARRTVQMEDLPDPERSHGSEDLRSTHSSRFLHATNSMRSLEPLTNEGPRRETTPSVLQTQIEDPSTSFMNMFTFTAECPPLVKELATACLQYDPSLRPSAQYIAAMLHQ